MISTILERGGITWGSLEAYFWDASEKVTIEENQALISPFTEEEIRAAVFIMNPDKAPGPDGFSMSFYQQGWDILKGVLLSMFNEFFGGKLDISQLNRAMSHTKNSRCCSNIRL